MLAMSKWFLIVGSALLIIDAIMIVAKIPNPIPGFPLPCPVTWCVLGIGLLLFAISSKTFKN
ncbi:MAG: hypothetical protein FJ022_07590 [Chloroflexi bacterium]|nr:hypothetical protein [Chloroflexota bacterium]MBM3166364.1 hypothetical protein [Chloroflexota bacterium]MBM3173837.1 hypothetical protein [Chloroflexota bacterium]MBM4450635.1 hypothetical protein [Chloroflexota bacterium]